MSTMAQPDLSENAPWKIKVAENRAAQYKKIPKEWRLAPEFLTSNENSPVSVLDVPAKSGILTPTELDITEKYTAASLAKAVQSGSVKAVDIATAFSKRAAIAQQLLSCLTETMFADAIKRGEYLDQYLAEHGKPVGPLHGVPVSLKDHHNYVGVASTAGYISFLDKPLPEKNSPLVELLLDLGAILYCKTNIPLTMMTADSQTNLFGRTLNPNKLSLTAGGSSGGEGALIAIRGSILGVGTDIGGSIRIPAICCGTYGFKPSSFRVPNGGVASPARAGSPGFPSVAGPLANSLEDCDLFLRNVVGSKPWNYDAGSLPIPWRESVASERNPKIRIGYFAGSSEYPLHPTVVRALEQTVKKLTSAGFTIVPLENTPLLQPAQELCSGQ
jgi:amidase